MSGPFLKGQFIKHKQAKDVCYFVKSVRCYNGKNVKYKLDIWNMGFENSWLLDKCIAEDLDLNNFQYLSGERKDCLRYCTWIDFQS